MICRSRKNPGTSIDDRRHSDSLGDRQGRARVCRTIVAPGLRRTPSTGRPAAKTRGSGHTLQATALVHEAYLRLVDVEQAQLWDGRRHFFAAAAMAMRRILVESARRKASQKRGGRLRRVDLVDQAASDPDDDLLALDEALNRLMVEDPIAARVVELRQFAGLGHEEIAATLGITVYLARQKWTYARAWLRRRPRGLGEIFSRFFDSFGRGTTHG